MMLPSKLQIYIGLVWPWSLTSWPPKLNISCPWPVSNGIKISCRSQNIVFTSLVTDTRMDGRTNRLTTLFLCLPAWGIKITQKEKYIIITRETSSQRRQSHLSIKRLLPWDLERLMTHTHTHTHMQRRALFLIHCIIYLFIYHKIVKEIQIK